MGLVVGGRVVARRWGRVGSVSGGGLDRVGCGWRGREDVLGTDKVGERAVGSSVGWGGGGCCRSFATSAGLVGEAADSSFGRGMAGLAAAVDIAVAVAAAVAGMDTSVAVVVVAVAAAWLDTVAALD